MISRRNCGTPISESRLWSSLLYLAKLKPSGRNQMTQYQAEQVRVIREIHDLLASNMERRFTIEELSHKYLMNPTTLKAVFKSVYGESIAAHMKEHRMKKAAALLHESDMSIAEIGRLVGYESQSKFTAAFIGILRLSAEGV